MQFSKAMKIKKATVMFYPNILSVSSDNGDSPVIWT